MRDGLKTVLAISALLIGAAACTAGASQSSGRIPPAQPRPTPVQIPAPGQSPTDTAGGVPISLPPTPTPHPVAS
jgi:hypothetical protein